MVNRQIFRAYDIRGVVDQTLTEEVVHAIGRALGTKVVAAGGRNFVVGRDGRLSGSRLLTKLIAGINATGCDVVDIGAVPTPCLYFANQYFDSDAAVMLTGSHNPPDYNGLKIIVGGVTIYGEQITELYDLIVNDQCMQVDAAQQGKVEQFDIVPYYVATIAQDIVLERTLKIVVDCGNGIAGKVVGDLYRQLGCEVEELYCEVDGNFPHHHPDPSDPHNLQELIARVKNRNADLGLAFDGDGDRIGIIDSAGKIIWPDRLLMLFAQQVLKAQPHATIIYDIKCSRAMDSLITAAAGKPLMWKTGHSLIKAKMRETHAALAGEMSGHIFFADRWYGFDDALYAGARLIEILSQQSQTSAEIFASIPEFVSTPELNINVTEDNKFKIIDALSIDQNFSDAEKIITIDGLRVEYPQGWGLIRASNTTPKLVIRFEAENDEVIQKIQAKFKLALAGSAKINEVPF